MGPLPRPSESQRSRPHRGFNPSTYSLTRIHKSLKKNGASNDNFSMVRTTQRLLRPRSLRVASVFKDKSRHSIRSKLLSQWMWRRAMGAINACNSIHATINIASLISRLQSAAAYLWFHTVYDQGKPLIFGYTVSTGEGICFSF